MHRILKKISASILGSTGNHTEHWQKLDCCNNDDHQQTQSNNETKVYQKDDVKDIKKEVKDIEQNLVKDENEYQHEQSVSNYEDEHQAALMNPMILSKLFHRLECCDLLNAARVCQSWRDIAKPMCQRIILNINNSENGIDPILRSYKKRVKNKTDKKINQWRPQLTMLFREDSIRLADKRIQKFMTSVIRNSRTFATSALLPAVSNLEETDAIDFMESQFTGFIFPEALLAQSGICVDIIFPSLELISEEPRLFINKPEKNKKLFEQLFGWKKEDPIKFAIVMSRRIFNESLCRTGNAYERAREIIRWLKSLPEGGNMPICVTIDLTSGYLSLPKAKTNGPISIILFGGEAIHAAAYFHIAEEPNIDEKFAQFEKTSRLEMPTVFQRIGIYITESFNQEAYAQCINCFPDVKHAILTDHDWTWGINSTEIDLSILDQSYDIHQNCLILIGFE